MAHIILHRFKFAVMLSWLDTCTDVKCCVLLLSWSVVSRRQNQADGSFEILTPASFL